jgi:eukaryotic-like serine/threonine-protein kinase
MTGGGARNSHPYWYSSKLAMSEPQEVVARYAVYDEIASGGMAKVHFARSMRAAASSRTVAIKRLHAHYANDPEFASMFLDEARLASRVAHPNVVSTIDVIGDGDALLIVMDYVPGETLSKLLRKSAARGEPVPVGVAVTMLSGVLHGLHAAHEAKDARGVPLDIVHRDVSPQNVIVGVDGIARVFDFGIAKATGRAQTTRDGHVKGKLGYMAPELLSGRVSRQSDVFAASIVLWEVLTGRRLFGADNEGEAFVKIRTLRIPPPSAHAAAIPPELDAVVLRGLDRDPSRRFASAHEMALALERSSPRAPASEVGDWVRSLAGDVIEERARKLEEIESQPQVEVAEPAPVARGAANVTPSPLVFAGPPARRPRGAALAFAAIVALLLGAGCAMAKRARDSKPRAGIAVSSSRTR